MTLNVTMVQGALSKISKCRFCCYNFTCFWLWNSAGI